LAMLCILSVFIPAFIMAEPVRSLFVPLSLAVGFAMITSYLLSSTLVPVLATSLLKGPKVVTDRGPSHAGRIGHGEGQGRSEPQPSEEGLHKGFFGHIQKVFIGFVRVTVAWRWVVVPAYLAGCLLILVVLGLQLGRELFPVVDQGQFVLRYHMPPGTNYELTCQAWLQCLREIEDVAGAGNVHISMGFAGQQAPDFAMNNMILFMNGPDDGQMRVRLREGSGVGIAELQEKLRQQLPKRLKPWLSGVLRQQGYSEAEAEERTGGLRISFEPGDIVSQVMSFGSPTPIEIVVSSPNLKEARTYVEKVLSQLKSNNYLRDLQIRQSLDYPVVEVRIDRQKANLSGVSTNEVGRSVLVATSSSRMLDRNYWIDTKLGASYQVQVQTPIQRMTSEDQIKTTPIERVTPGLNLMVRDVAGVAKGFMPGEYNRTAMQRFLSITANVEGEDLGRAAKQIDQAIGQAGQPPRGVHIDNRGQVSPMNEMFESLAVGLAISVFVILVLLAAYFQSPLLALSSIGAVPGVLSGVVLILFFTHTTLNIESFMGTIMSVGVSVSNSVMLVTFMAMEWQKGASVYDSAVRGAGERLRPILMTACAMTIGMVPMSLGLESGSKTEAPLGMAVIGGLVLSTFATLLILPAIYTLLLGKRRFVQPSIDPDDPMSSYYDGGEETSRRAFRERQQNRGNQS
jgi:multidrug efflux pump subunit AcrB